MCKQNATTTPNNLTLEIFQLKILCLPSSVVLCRVDWRDPQLSRWGRSRFSKFSFFISKHSWVFPPLQAHSFDIKYFINITFNKLNRTSQERLGRGDVELAKQNRIFQFQGGTISKGGNIEFLTHINYSFAQFDSAWMELLWKFSHFIDSIFSLRALSPSTREPSNRTHNTLTVKSMISKPPTPSQIHTI